MAGEMSIKVNEWKRGQMVSSMKREIPIPEPILQKMLAEVLEDFMKAFPQKEVITASISVPEVKAVVVFRVDSVKYPEGSEQ